MLLNFERSALRSTGVKGVRVASCAALYRGTFCVRRLSSAGLSARAYQMQTIRDTGNGNDTGNGHCDTPAIAGV
jgi:hypothetical protein